MALQRGANSCTRFLQQHEQTSIQLLHSTKTKEIITTAVLENKSFWLTARLLLLVMEWLQPEA